MCFIDMKVSLFQKFQLQTVDDVYKPVPIAEPLKEGEKNMLDVPENWKFCELRSDDRVTIAADLDTCLCYVTFTRIDVIWSYYETHS